MNYAKDFDKVDTSKYILQKYIFMVCIKICNFKLIIYYRYCDE